MLTRTHFNGLDTGSTLLVRLYTPMPCTLPATDVRTTLYAEELRETTSMTWERCCQMAEWRRDMIAAGQCSGFSQGEAQAINAREADVSTRLAVRRLRSPAGARIASTAGLRVHRPTGLPPMAPMTMRALGENLTLTRSQWADLLYEIGQGKDSELGTRIADHLAGDPTGRRRRAT